MCDISKKTTFKRKTVYKAVIKNKEHYYSYFAGTPIEIGKVNPQQGNSFGTPEYKLFFPNNIHYNPNMIGRCSGFFAKEDAKKFVHESPAGTRLLKIVLGGEIMQGTTAKICSPGCIPWDHITYAGTEILSFEEIN